METAQPPVALTIAGSDCSAGAGLQADLKAFSACGVYGVTAVSALVVEAPGIVSRVEAQLPEVVAEQVRLLSDTFPIAAAKTGLLASADVVRAVQKVLEPTTFPLVVDPVAVASTGYSMVGPGFADALREFIEKRASLVTPNRKEAEELLGKPIASCDAAKEAASALSRELGCPVLLKGGHFDGSECVDFLAEGNRIESITGARIPDGDIHGTGCTYSAAITARLAQGFELAEAVRLARRYLHETLAAAYVWPKIRGESVKALAHFPENSQT